MQIALNRNTTECSGPVSVFRRSVKRTAKGLHVGIIGDFETSRAAKNEIYLWSCIKRRTNHRLLFKVVFWMGI